MNMEKVSVLMPCLNEENGVGICIKKIQEVFKKENIDGEIIVIDNGSTDKTIDIVKSFGVKVIHELRRGYGNAYLTGFKHATGDIIIMGDADNTYNFYDIPKFLYEIKDSDFVIGNRKYLNKNSSPFLHRYIGRPVFSILLRWLFHLNISDSHCGFGAIKRDALDKLKLQSIGMEFASEILIKAQKNHLRIKEIPIIYYDRIGSSKLRTFKDGTRHLYLITKEFLNQVS